MNRAVLLVAVGIGLSSCAPPFSELAQSRCQAAGFQPGTPAFTRCFYETRDHAMASATGAALDEPGVWRLTQPTMLPIEAAPPTQTGPGRPYVVRPLPPLTPVNPQ